MRKRLKGQFICRVNAPVISDSIKKPYVRIFGKFMPIRETEIDSYKSKGFEIIFL